MKKKIIGGLSLILFIILMFTFKTNFIRNIDAWAFNSFNHNSFWTHIFKFFSIFGEVKTILVLIVITFILSKKWGLIEFINTGIVGVINQIVKHIIKRPRPAWKIVKESGYSFPSGHSMLSLVFYGTLIILIWKSNLKKQYKILFSIFLTCFILLIGLSRVYLGVHYLSDVLSGFLITLAYLLLVYPYIEKKLKNKM